MNIDLNHTDLISEILRLNDQISELQYKLKMEENIVSARDFQNEMLETEIEQLRIALRTHQICGKQLQIDSLHLENKCLREEIRELKQDLKQSVNQSDYYLKSWDSTKKDLAMFQRFMRGSAQAKTYYDVFKREAM